MALPLRFGHPCLRDALLFRMDCRMDHGSSPSGNVALWRNNLQRKIMGELGMKERYLSAPSYRPYRSCKPVCSDDMKPMRFFHINKTGYNICPAS